VVTIHHRVATARERLEAAGIAADEADLDSRLLAEHLLGWDTARFFTAAGEAEPAGFAGRYEALVARRAAREPVSYIVGHHEFWNLAFEVSPAVLIPRPETELIVEIALELLGRSPEASRHSVADRSAEASRYSVADVCTGSGCIAVALARELPSARFIAVDLSDAALEVAKRNAARHQVERRIDFARANVLDGVSGPFDLIVSNPPYVRADDRAALQPEVRDYEPALALFAGRDGLDVIRRLLVQAPPRLAPGGAVVFEIGFGQADSVAQLISATPGLKMVGLRPDLQGIPRTAVALRECS
jgi:release factor glutamine methyltransferase